MSLGFQGSGLVRYYHALLRAPAVFAQLKIIESRNVDGSRIRGKPIAKDSQI